MITALFQALTEALGGFADAFASVVQDVVSIFWDGEALTMVGTLAIISLAIGVVYGVIRWVSRLVHMRG